MGERGFLMMSGSAKAYIAAVVLAGAAVLVGGIGLSRQPDPAHLGVWLALALVASALKIRMPGVTGTFSLNPVFIILAAAYGGLGSALPVGCAAVLAQSFWRPKVRPTAVQIVFNISNVAISTGVAWLVYRTTRARYGWTDAYALLAVAAALYFLVNTGLVSVILAAVDSKPLRSVMGTWFACALPYYVIGTILASQIAPPPLRARWGALLSLSAMVLLYLWYRWQMEHFDPHGPARPG
jgi:hypothetical protein